MTFSLRLTADLTLALAARAMSSKQGHPPILQLSPGTDFQIAVASSSLQEEWIGSPHSGNLVSRSRSPILWIAGAEPLDYPEVARFTNALAASGRSVFLETSGVSLKRRLHEFQPSSRFYFAVRFDSFDPAPEESNSHDGAFRIGMEAIRMARLAGFFACAHLEVPPDAGVHSPEKLHAEITKRGVDGSLITSSVVSPDFAKTVNGLRRRLLSWRWAVLSRLVESVALPAASRDSRQIDRQSVSESQSASFEEGTEAG
jgi:hypothetical protein